MPKFFPRVRGRALGLSLLLLAALFVGAHALTNVPQQAAGPAVGLAPAHAAVDGQQIYMTRCMSCHQMNGQGIAGVFPPLNGSEWVVGDKGRLVRIILHGLSGEIEVKGQTYSGAMPPWGSFLSDEEVAELSTYIRTNWGNEASAVTAEEVAKIRAASSDRKKPWTAEELVAATGK